MRSVYAILFLFALAPLVSCGSDEPLESAEPSEECETEDCGSHCEGDECEGEPHCEGDECEGEGEPACIEPDCPECTDASDCEGELVCQEGSCVAESPLDFCDGVPSLAEESNNTFTRALTIIDDPSDPQDGTEFSAVWLAPFPGISVQRRIRLLPDQYASIRFETPEHLNSTHHGNFTVEMMAGYNGANRLFSISRCEGDFNPDTVAEGCIRSLTGLENFRWQGVSHPTRCVLEPGQEYFLNIVHTDDPVGTPLDQITPSCVPTSLGYCGQLYLHAHSLTD